jgi:hypothetical protein
MMRALTPITHGKIRAFLFGMAFVGGLYDASAWFVIPLIAAFLWSFWDEDRWTKQG